MNTSDARTVGIVGAGGMGTAITKRLTHAGHSVLITDSKPEAAALAAKEGDGEPGRAQASSIEEVLAAEFVILALWYPGTTEFAARHSEQLGGKIVVDIANPLDSSFTGLTTDPSTSAAEEVAAALSDSAVVKAFNTVPAPTLLPGAVGGVELDTFVAGDDQQAKDAVMGLLSGSGLRALDAGSLANSRLLERLTAFGIELGQRYGLGFGFGFKYLPFDELARLK